MRGTLPVASCSRLVLAEYSPHGEERRSHLHNLYYVRSRCLIIHRQICKDCTDWYRSNENGQTLPPPSRQPDVVEETSWRGRSGRMAGVDLFYDHPEEDDEFEVILAPHLVHS